MFRVTIIGMGLIGTSLGMALRTADPKESPLGEIKVTGYDRDSRALKEARGRLAIDVEARSLTEAARDAQLVVIATPVQAIQEILTQLGSLLPAGAVVTDVASTKAEVGRWAAKALPSGVHYVGGHPMAGREKSGPAAADPDLFVDAIYCLTASPNVADDAINIVEGMVNQVLAKPYFIDPDEHDAYVAGISHLPFLLSTLLVDVTTGSPAWKEMAPLAATGYRDLSRLAAGDPEMYRDICATNKTAIGRWLNEAARRLIDLNAQIQAGDASGLEALFRETRERREAWLSSKPNLRPGEADFNQPLQAERPNLFTFRRPKKG